MQNRSTKSVGSRDGASTRVMYFIRYSIEYSSSCFEQNGVASTIVYNFFISLVVKIIPISIVNVHFNYRTIKFQLCEKLLIPFIVIEISLRPTCSTWCCHIYSSASSCIWWMVCSRKRSFLLYLCQNCNMSSTEPWWGGNDKSLSTDADNN